MRIKWLVIIAISLIMIGCGPQTRIQKTYIQMDHENAGEVIIFNSFDEVGRSYIKVAALEVTTHKPPNNTERNKMIESLNSKARKVGAEGIVIIDEGRHVSRILFEGRYRDFYTFFIKGIAIVYE